MEQDIEAKGRQFQIDQQDLEGSLASLGVD